MAKKKWLKEDSAYGILRMNPESGELYTLDKNSPEFKAIIERETRRRASLKPPRPLLEEIRDTLQLELRDALDSKRGVALGYTRVDLGDGLAYYTFYGEPWEDPVAKADVLQMVTSYLDGDWRDGPFELIIEMGRALNQIRTSETEHLALKSIERSRNAREQLRPVNAEKGKKSEQYQRTVEQFMKKEGLSYTKACERTAEVFGCTASNIIQCTRNPSSPKRKPVKRKK